jgi:hypothetical protein
LCAPPNVPLARAPAAAGGLPGTPAPRDAKSTGLQQVRIGSPKVSIAELMHLNSNPPGSVRAVLRLCRDGEVCSGCANHYSSREITPSGKGALLLRLPRGRGATKTIRGQKCQKLAVRNEQMVGTVDCRARVGNVILHRDHAHQHSPRTESAAELSAGCARCMCHLAK